MQLPNEMGRPLEGCHAEITAFALHEEPAHHPEYEPYVSANSSDILHAQPLAETAADSREPGGIQTIPDDVLLDIFEYHRLGAKRHSSLEHWEWRYLAHVCRRWRFVIFASPRRLKLRLVYTYKKPGAKSGRKTLDCWPPLPITIWYPRFQLPTPDDEDNIIAALECPDRVRQINLVIPDSFLWKSTAPLKESFQALERVQLASLDVGGVSSLALASTFLGGSAPQLRYLHLCQVAFPTISRLLSSTRDLVSLRLDMIPPAGWFSPETLVTGLRGMTRLRFIELRFLTPISFPDHESAQPPPSTDRAVLPSLTEFRFDGAAEFLEDLVARIEAPVLEQLHVKAFGWLASPIPQLPQFIGCSKVFKLSPSQTSIALGENDCVVSHLFRHLTSLGVIRLHFVCHGIGQRVSSLANLLRQPFPPLASVDQLNIDTHQAAPDPEDRREYAQWLDILNLFSGVKKLDLYGTSSPVIASALEQSAPGSGQGVLPVLNTLRLGGPWEPAPIQSFVAARQLSEHPISVHLKGERLRRLSV